MFCKERERGKEGEREGERVIVVVVSLLSCTARARHLTTFRIAGGHRNAVANSATQKVKLGQGHKVSVSHIQQMNYRS